MENINLIRSIAWSFCKTMNHQIDWEELFSEACLSYLEAMQSYDPEKSCKETTWVYYCIRDTLSRFCQNETRYLKNKELELDWKNNIITQTPEYEYFERSFRSIPRSDEFKAFSKETRTIINLVMRDPLKYAVPPKKAVGKIRRNLEERGWTIHKINVALKVLKMELIKNN